MSRSSKAERLGIWVPEPGMWGALLLLCVVVIGLTDSTLLHLGRAYFTGGFNAIYLDSVALVAGFVAGGLLLDLTFVLGLWGLILPVIKRIPAPRFQRFAFLGMLTLAIPALLDYARYSLHYILGDMVSPLLLWIASGRDFEELLFQIVDRTNPLVFLIVAVLIGIWIVLSTVGRVERRLARADQRFRSPRSLVFWVAFPLAFALSTILLVTTASTSRRIHYGFGMKASGALLIELVQYATDVDGDGFGLLSLPPDAAPFDAARNPSAVDVPGNGVDENGLAGDLPEGNSTARPVELDPAALGDRRPHMLLVFLESFRADLLDARRNGREITPFLNRLAREGAHSDRAFVHTPSTVASRAQLFGGHLISQSGQSTLIDDFKQLGYEVAIFSGQDDSYGGSESLLGLDRADVFYDARQDVDRRISRSSSPVSLQISWKLLNERVFAFLDARSDTRPLFLYVNFTDSHFPYHHGDLDDRLGIDPLPRDQINREHAERVFDTYANSAANVDLATERLVDKWKGHLPGQDLALLITADHGQEIFDYGFLGHNQSVNAAQSQVPFILWGVGGTWPEPLGLADVRGLLNNQLFRRDPDDAYPPVARFEEQAEREILQYSGRWWLPREIGLRDLDGATVYSFQEQRLERLEGGERRGIRESDRKRALDKLIHSWEAARVRSNDGARIVEPGPGGR